MVKTVTKSLSPCGHVNNIKHAIGEPQVEHRNLLFEFVDKNNQQIPQIANQLKFSKVDLSYQLPPPILGDPTKEVLIKELDLTGAKIIELKTQGVIA